MKVNGQKSVSTQGYNTEKRGRRMQSSEKRVCGIYRTSRTVFNTHSKPVEQQHDK